MVAGMRPAPEYTAPKVVCHGARGVRALSFSGGGFACEIGCIGFSVLAFGGQYWR